MHEPAPDSQTLLEARGDPFPNTHGRRRALAYHDLHHILTGYRTDFVGEL